MILGLGPGVKEDSNQFRLPEINLERFVHEIPCSVLCGSAGSSCTHQGEEQIVLSPEMHMCSDVPSLEKRTQCHKGRCQEHSTPSSS